MRTLTLAESVFFAKSQPFRKKSPQVPFTSSSSSLLCSNSLPQKQRLLQHGTPTSVFAFSRHSKRGEEWNGLSPQANAHEIPELSLFYGENNKTTLGAMHNLNGSGDASHDQISSSNEGCTYTTFGLEEAAISMMSSCRWLKFPMLVGLLTLLDTQQAMAGSGSTTGLQSVPYLGDLGDISTGFASAFLLIFFSELGDKTFFIAALLAARNSATIIFIGTFGALAAMTIVSVVLGRTFHYVDDILPFRFGETDLPLDDIAAVCLLTYFGVSTLIEAASSDGQKTEEEQKEAEIAVSDFSGDGAGLLAAANTVFSTFLVVFVAEWGDKSFFSTIALAAASSPLGVIGGALAGHAAATLLAVLGGSLLGTFLSEKAVAYVGGTLFLVFAAVTLVEIVT